MRDTVLAAAKKLGLEVRVATASLPARTVEAAAKAVGAEPAQIATALVFVVDGDPVVTLASGTATVDAQRLCDLLDCADIRPASADEVRAATGFPASAVCPIGHDVPVWFDRGLLRAGPEVPNLSVALVPPLRCAAAVRVRRAGLRTA